MGAERPISRKYTENNAGANQSVSHKQHLGPRGVLTGARYLTPREFRLRGLDRKRRRKCREKGKRGLCWRYRRMGEL